MKIYLPSILILSVLLLSHSIVHGQSSPDSTTLSKEQEAKYYEKFSKSNTVAVLLGVCVLPSSGHAYAGNWGRGLPFAGVRYASLIGGLIATADNENSDKTLAAASAVIYLAFTVWEGIDASNQVDEYNSGLKKMLSKKTYGFDVIPTGNGLQLKLVLHL